MKELTVGKFEPPILTTTEKSILVELLCGQQQVMLTMDELAYLKADYKRLEQLKIKIKDM